MSYGKEISIWFLAVKYVSKCVYKVVHGWHNLMVGSRRMRKGPHDENSAIVG